MKKRYYFMLCGLVVAFALGRPAAAQTQERPRYQIRAFLDAEQKSVTFTEEVTFTNNSPDDLSELYFHIYPNRSYTRKEKSFTLRYGGYFKVNPFPEDLPREGMQIESVISGNSALSYQIEGQDQTLLKVVLPQPLKSAESFTLTLTGKVKLPHMYGRFGWNENIIKLSQWYPVLCVCDEDGWHKYPFYPFHRPFFSESSFYAVEMDLPADYAAVHTGIQTKEEDLGDGRKRLFYETPLPVRDFTLVLSPDYQVVEGSLGDVRIRSFYLPGDEAAARTALENARQLMQYYTERFGPYPYPEFSIAPVHLGYGGEQMSNLVFIDTRVYKLPGLLRRYFDFLIVHETGHQWFYNLVGMDEYNEMWLEEGVNSFFIMQYLEKKYGPEASIVDYPAWFKKWEGILPRLTFKQTRDLTYKMLERIGYDQPVIAKLWSFREPSTIFSLTYGKGSRIVEMLRHYLGEEKFDEMFKKIFEDYCFRNLKVADLIRLSEEQYGQGLSWFFQPWLYEAKRFDYAITGVRGRVISFENRGAITMPADVVVVFSDGQRRMITWDGRERQMLVDDPREITSVSIDPEGMLLDIDRTNNNWPRKVYKKPVPLYIGLYENPAFVPEDGYSLIVGPETAHSGLGVKASFQKPFDYILYTAGDYEFGENLVHTRAGYQMKNVFHTQTAAGIEVMQTDDLGGDEEDLLSGKVYLRRELWPARYGLLGMNDHLTLYLMRNQRLNDKIDSTSIDEDARNLDYSRRDESITGVELHLDRSGPYPSPVAGYQLTALAENAGHFWGADQAFTRTSLDCSFYQRVSPRSVVAYRLKYGRGFPNDKELFHIGGIDGLRGYRRKTVRGANALLGSVEYRFPLLRKLDTHVLDNILGFESLGGVVFVDAGQAWYGDFGDTTMKADAGLGLRLTVNIGSFLEKLVIRFDAAQSINDTKESPRFWLGVNQAF